jgi:hypothetical protein
MMLIYIVAMQYRLIVDGYWNMTESYNRYKSNNNKYTILTADVIDTKKHILAGLDGIIESHVYYCTVCYDFGGKEYRIFTKVIPDCSVGQKVEIAVCTNNPIIVERTSPYGINKYHWMAQFFVIIFTVLIYKFFLIIKGLYED